MGRKKKSRIYWTVASSFFSREYNSLWKTLEEGTGWVRSARVDTYSVSSHPHVSIQIWIKLLAQGLGVDIRETSTSKLIFSFPPRSSFKDLDRFVWSLFSPSNSLEEFVSDRPRISEYISLSIIFWLPCWFMKRWVYSSSRIEHAHEIHRNLNDFIRKCSNLILRRNLDRPAYQDSHTGFCSSRRSGKIQGFPLTAEKWSWLNFRR